ncbi:MAG: protein-L-isoaspartate(D-aspartate) O-methyltransferase [Chthoniobacterales bacterium]|nr:protein-L-isoaspartate(D-aspartate) O-methyltransferase [Chthoniobacterales bacterium]
MAKMRKISSRRWRPTRHWAEGALFSLLAGCHASPGPLELDGQREAMVSEQIEARGISDPATLAAMRVVPRHEFVPAGLREDACGDYPLPIGNGQTISQPYIVAFMTEAIRPRPGEKILEIGAGSGYQAAVLAQTGAEVYSVEIVEPLAEMARQNLERLGFANAHVKQEDGHRGWPEHAPFDAIIVTCAPDKIPPDLVAQLREGGRMIIPIGGGMEQELILLRKHGDKIEKQPVLPVRFVPMTGEAEKAR